MSIGEHSDLIRLLMLGGLTLACGIAFYGLRHWDRGVKETLERLTIANRAQNEFSAYAGRILHDQDTPPVMRYSIEFISECLENNDMARRFVKSVRKRGITKLTLDPITAEIQARLIEERARLERNRNDLLEAYETAIMIGTAAICFRSPKASSMFAYTLTSAYPISSVASSLASSDMPRTFQSRTLAPCS